MGNCFSYVKIFVLEKNSGTPGASSIATSREAGTELMFILCSYKTSKAFIVMTGVT